jgi:transmembrane sensor
MLERPVQSSEKIKEAASRWVLRLESGLTAAEERQFEAWIEADSRHAAVLTEQQAVWDQFGSLGATVQSSPVDADVFAPASKGRRLRVRVAAPLLAAAAAVVFGVFTWSSRPARTESAPIRVTLPALVEQRTLTDGSVVELNRGARIEVAFDPTTRRVRLLQGEANFTVAKNDAVPFVVTAGATEVRAVGTAFNVRFDPRAVEVVVTHGKVQVTPPPEKSGAPRADIPILEAGQRTVVSLGAQPAVTKIVTLAPEELEDRLAWQPKLLDFDDAPLAAIISEFNRRNPVRLIIRDPAIGALRLNASFRSDNMEGFVRLLESHFGIETEPLNATEVGLRKAR